MAVRKAKASTSRSSLTGENNHRRGKLPHDDGYWASVEQSVCGVFVRCRKGKLVEVNQAFAGLLGYSPEELYKRDFFDFCCTDDDVDRVQTLEQKLVKSSPHGNTEIKLRTRAGNQLSCLVGLTVQRNSQGTLAGSHGVVHDITNLRLAESQLAQAQKMESLARLCGGIAHDFNNLLGGIMGYASLLRNKLEPGTESYEFAQIIEEATHRGAQLTRQMLVAAHKGPFRLGPVDVNGVVREVKAVLRCATPDSITVAYQLSPNLPVIQGVHSQVQQLLTNLCMNAIDSMPKGGEMLITTREARLSDEFRRSHLLDQSGPYIELSVKDSGPGITEADQPNIFEPFYTTKEPRRGTGLGLAVVYALVKNHWGAIEVDSAPGKGSTFRVYLPVHHPLAG